MLVAYLQLKEKKRQPERMQSNDVYLTVLNIIAVKSKIHQSWQIQITFCREVVQNRQENTRSASVPIPCLPVQKSSQKKPF